MCALIDEHLDGDGAEPVCRVFQLASSTYYARGTGRPADLVERRFTASAENLPWAAAVTHNHS